jgi:hypothetical protein
LVERHVAQAASARFQGTQVLQEPFPEVFNGILDFTTPYVITGNNICDMKRTLNLAVHERDPFLVGPEQDQISDIPGEVIWSANSSGLAESVFHQLFVEGAFALDGVWHFDFASKCDSVDSPSVQDEIVPPTGTCTMLLNTSRSVRQVRASLQDS